MNGVGARLFRPVAVGNALLAMAMQLGGGGSDDSDESDLGDDDDMGELNDVSLLRGSKKLGKYYNAMGMFDVLAF